jgi:3'-5' exonuclease
LTWLATKLSKLHDEDVVIVWDLETISDLAAARRMLDMGQASEEEVRAALGAGFPKHPLHKVACIGALIANRGDKGWEIEGARLSPHRPAD